MALPAEQREQITMRPSFKEKVLAFIAVMAGTGAMIFISTHLVTGALGVCK